MIVCEGNSHGRTLRSLLSPQRRNTRRASAGPFTPGFKIVPYGDLQPLENAITPNTAAFLVEPIQGEAGINLPREGYLRQAWQLCKERNVLFIADEIQTGFGRTGQRFACDWEQVVPDMYVLGKALRAACCPYPP
ncbi:aminotransferase class III-fold pyridoxal phosphate-dependent enzyme [Paenibacillus sp. A3]|uniref:aminotransferase class III-fold pyridoxal phosphate-dependent enzyme n=1 Tax=Paenibacillus sp. A3 TaxID=1337054 RepID=UPI0006D5ABE4